MTHIVRRSAFSVFLSLLILALGVPAVPVQGAAAVPTGYSNILQDAGVTLYENGNYRVGHHAYVQVVSLQMGASIRLLHGSISDPGTGQGVYGGNNPTFQRTSIQTAWDGFSAANAGAFCITNGQFFSPTVDPTPLAFPLKRNGVNVSDGYGSADPIYSGKLLMLELWANRADIRPLSKDAFLASTAPNILGGFTEDYPKSPYASVGRTFVGIDDTDGNGSFETVLVFNSDYARQSDAAQALRDFGADKVIMFDGGGSTQLECKGGTTYLPGDGRLIPQTIGVVKGTGGFNSQFTTDAAGWTKLNGTWNVSGGTYNTLGLSSVIVSTMNNSTSPKFTFQARMKRTGCAGCVNSLYFRGNPYPLTNDPMRTWNNAYRLSYNNFGYYQFLYNQGGAYYSLINFTPTSAIVKNGWNTLKVTMNGTFVQLFINGTRLAYGNISIFSTGKMGIGFYRDPSSTGNQLMVDWATMVPSAPASADAAGGTQIAPIDLDSIMPASGHVNIGP